MSYLPEAPYRTLEEEFEARIQKAFVEDGNRYVFIYSKHERFRLAMMDFGAKKGWVNCVLQELDSQSSTLCCELTPEGVKHFGFVSIA